MIEFDENLWLNVSKFTATFKLEGPFSQDSSLLGLFFKFLLLSWQPTLFEGDIQSFYKFTSWWTLSARLETIVVSSWQLSLKLTSTGRSFEPSMRSDGTHFEFCGCSLSEPPSPSSDPRAPKRSALWVLRYFNDNTPFLCPMCVAKVSRFFCSVYTHPQDIYLLNYILIISDCSTHLPQDSVRWEIPRNSHSNCRYTHAHTVSLACSTHTNNSSNNNNKERCPDQLFDVWICVSIQTHADQCTEIPQILKKNLQFKCTFLVFC